MISPGTSFTSPVAFQPYPGKAITAAILRAVIRVFEDFRYVREIGGERDHALVFEATIDGKRVTGCDFLHVDEDGRIDDFMVMVRPLSAARKISSIVANGTASTAVPKCLPTAACENVPAGPR